MFRTCLFPFSAQNIPKIGIAIDNFCGNFQPDFCVAIDDALLDFVRQVLAPAFPTRSFVWCSRGSVRPGSALSRSTSRTSSHRRGERCPGLVARLFPHSSLVQEPITSLIVMSPPEPEPCTLE